MNPEEAVRRLNTVLAHAWMVRTFLKHADEIQASEEMLDVPRTLYDGIRAVEPAYQRGDLADYLRRLKGKLPKIRRAVEYFAAHYKEFSPHTNFEMAAASLAGVVRQMEEIFAAVNWDEVTALAKARQREQGADAPRSPEDPLDDIEIPEV
jgi:heme oxygenase